MKHNRFQCQLGSGSLAYYKDNTPTREPIFLVDHYGISISEKERGGEARDSESLTIHLAKRLAGQGVADYHILDNSQREMRKKVRGGRERKIGENGEAGHSVKRRCEAQTRPGRLYYLFMFLLHILDAAAEELLRAPQSTHHHIHRLMIQKKKEEAANKRTFSPSTSPSFLTLEGLQAVLLVEISAPERLVVLVVRITAVNSSGLSARELLRRAYLHRVTRREKRCH